MLADDCGTPLETGTVQVQFSGGEEPLGLNATGGGYWEASWVPAGTANGVTLQLAPGSGAPIAQICLKVAATAAAIPAIYRGGVVSAADPLPLAPLARGGLMAIYGSGLADSGLRAGTTPLPPSLANVQVLLAGQPLPLLYVSPGQIDAVIPYDVPAGVPMPVVVSNGSRQSLPETVVIASAQPAVFILPQFGPAQAAAVGPGGLATPQSPVTAGDRLVIYCEGLGSVTPDFTAGGLAPSDTLYRTANPVSVSIGGQPAVVEFAGLAPGSVGEYQINVVVPAGIPPGGAVPLVIAVAGASSSASTIAVR